MQEIVTENVNDLEFLKILLTTEIDKIKNSLSDLKKYPKVQSYIILEKKRENLKINQIYGGLKKIEIKDKIDNLINTYIEVKQYVESINALSEFEEDLINLDNLISIDGIIYNKEKKYKVYYSPRIVLKHLIELKESKGLSSILTIEELNNYIDAVRETLQNQIHYEDDKVVDEILTYKVYENPCNYDIKNIREIPSINLEYLYKKDNLTEREKEAFFGTNAYKALGISKEQDKVKRIGAKRNV